MKNLFLIIAFGVFIAKSSSQIQKDETNKAVVCYYTNWSPTRSGNGQFTPQKIDPFLCTHLLYAFAKITRGKLSAGTPEVDIKNNGFNDINNLKKVNDKLKTILSIGGSAEGPSIFSNMTTSKEEIDTFTKSTINLLRQYNFDGINIDWHYPTVFEGSRPDDRENYVKLVKALKEGFENEAKVSGQTRLLVTMTLPSEKQYIEQGYDLLNLQKYVDFFNLVSYDYHYSMPGVTSHHAPLYSLPQDIKKNSNETHTVDASLQLLMNKGVLPEKLTLGIPTYGRSFKLKNSEENGLGAPTEKVNEDTAVGFKPYYELCKIIKDENWTVVNVNKTALGPYAYKGSDWIAYDDEDMVRRKGEYARNKNLYGIMFWTVDDDDFRGDCGNKYGLIKAAKQGLTGVE